MVEIPDLPLDELEAAAETEYEDKSVKDESGGSVVFGLLGAGQAGGRIVESFYRLGYKKCLAVNTAPHDLDGLEEIPEQQKILMSTGEAGGAGKDMRKGETATDNHLQEIYERMQKVFGDVDRVLVCAGAGGGCIDSKTKILTDRFGLIEIEDLWDKVLEDSGESLVKIIDENTLDAKIVLRDCYSLKVASSDKEGNVTFKNIDILWNNSDKGVAYSIETQNGIVTTSAKHPFFVFDFENNALVKKQASEITEEDFLYAYNSEEFDKFIPNALYENDWLWLLGYFAGDGNFKEKSVIRFFDENLLNLQKAEKLCKRYGATSTSISRDNRQNSYELYVYGVDIATKLRNQFNISDSQCKTRNLKLPKAACTKREYFVAFLAGLLDSDGYVKAGRDSFEVMMIDISFLNEVCEQARLHGINVSFGIKSSVRNNEQPLGRALFQHTKLNGYQNILIENLEAKRNKFEDNVSIGSIFPVSFDKISHLVDERCKQDRYFWDYVHNKHLLSQSKAQVFFSEYGKGVLKKCWQYLIPVKSVITEDDVNYFDLTVDENASYFAGNGQMYLVHNTGGGGCLRLVEIAKKYLTYLGLPNVEKRVGVLVTLPTAGEAASPTVADNAHLIASKLCEFAEKDLISPLIIFDNDKIKRMYPKLTVRKFWPTVNATVTGLFHMFNVLSTKTGNPTSFDPADYNRVLSAGGCMIMGLTTLKQYGDGTDISQAIRSNMEKGLLCGGFDVSTAEAAACIATASEGILNDTPGLMNSLETGFDTLANITGNAAVFRGIYEVDKEKFVIYTMLTGLNSPIKRLTELKKFQNTSTTEKTKLYE